MWTRAAHSVLVLFLCFQTTFALKTEDWKKCADSGFCRRGRALAARAEAASDWKSPYSVDPTTVSVSSIEATLTAAVKSSIHHDVKFKLDLNILKDGVVRVRMDEVDGLKQRYNEAAAWALISQPESSTDIKWTVGKRDARAAYGKDISVVVNFDPLKITLLRGGKEEVVLNGGGLLHMEHFRKKEEVSEPTKVEGDQAGGQAQKVIEVNPALWFEGEPDALWEETWRSWTDSKPKGPESLSIDINFPRHNHVYGIPQRATSISLPTTKGEGRIFEEPYRLYNADVFEYHASSPMSLYGSIPVMYAHSTHSTVGVFHVVGSETWIDVAHPSEHATNTHWISESGILDTFILPGPTPADVFSQYARLTGTPVMPAQWALGYHQCRWNYVSSDDVRGVQKRFDEEDMPVDVFWLDIEYAEDHKYFMWNKKTFPDPVAMVKDVEAIERKMVVIVDPHVKRVQDYPVYKEASELGILVKPPSGEGEYEGWCWPGSSSWVDYFNPKSWDWWKRAFKTTKQDNGFSWVESTENVHIWNDMNEPSVFNGPEITMPKDNIHYGGWEHRDVHNINGMLFSNQTWQAVYERSNPPKRPFVLTRAFFAGSQRFGAMWTGDNLGTWEHMAVGIKMVLANSLAGMSFSGSDVGGFFGNPEPEMLVRWYQVGAFAPFFRAHAHIDTKRREPYLLEEPYKSIVRDILKLRYSLLPVWYTAFRETSVTGVPVLRPQFVMFPDDERAFSLDDQFYVGSSGLLVKPVTGKGATEVAIYLSDKQAYYDYFTGKIYRGDRRFLTVPAGLDQIPVFIRGGSIVPTRERPRRSSPLMKHDPFTLRIALDNTGAARGELYLDDGESYQHHQGEFVWREFTAGKAPKKSRALRIASRDLASKNPGEAVETHALATYDAANAYAKTLSVAGVRVERILVLGLASKPSTITIEDGKTLEWTFTEGISAVGSKEGEASLLTIKNPGVGVVDDWAIVIE